MEFASPQEKATAYLILRHVYDGDVIEWPIGDDHPLRHIFLALEAQGLLARWDRTWPLHDRYRLTDKGIAAIEAVYKPGEAEQIMREVRAQRMSARQRRAYLTQRGYDPYVWPVIHDPATSWDMDWDDGEIGYGTYYGTFWEDDLGYRSRRDVDEARAPALDVPALEVADSDDPGLAKTAAAAYVVDLDREAGADGGAGPTAMDYDVS
ncbi:MAG TPA: hypothetical protein VFP84_12725 [Kofleriaceae bacterium]|nr:hypothetical protein [Kofleriaceae bacterium]